MSRIIKTLVLLIAAIFSGHLGAQSAGNGLKITPLTGDFYVFTTYKILDGKPFPSNGMYMVTNKGAVLFDTPWDTSQTLPLLDSIRARHSQPVVLSLSTHYHDDRTGALNILKNKGIKTYSSLQTQTLCQEHDEPQASLTFQGDTTFTIGNHSFQTYYAGEGHTKDNIVVWFEKEKILYGGCLIKSVEAVDMGFTGNANLEAWPATLRNIERKFGRPLYIIPGHQRWDDIKAIRHTLKLLKIHKHKK